MFLLCYNTIEKLMMLSIIFLCLFTIENDVFNIFNPRRACAGGLLYLSCVSVMTFSATSFVSTLESRYVRVDYRLFLIFNSWIFDKPFRSEVMA